MTSTKNNGTFTIFLVGYEKGPSRKKHFPKDDPSRFTYGVESQFFFVFNRKERFCDMFYVVLLKYTFQWRPRCLCLKQTNSKIVFNTKLVIKWHSYGGV